MRLPLSGEDTTKQPVQVTSTERMSFAPGGVIRLNTSSDNLMVEAWDRPEVDVTTIKSTRNSYEPERRGQGAQCLESVRTVTERLSSNELAVSAALPSRSFFKHPWGAECGVTVEHQISVPRDSRLVIRHGAGYVLVSRVTGDIDATSRSGDIVLMLPSPGLYSIDARSKIGSVSSDFPGAIHGTNLVGEQFASTNPAPSRRIHLRIGFGGITIKEVPSTPEAPVAASVP